MRKVGLLVAGLWLVVLTGCDLAPDFKLPELNPPKTYKEQSTENQQPATTNQQPIWAEAKSLAKEDRGQWWKVFGDEQLSALEQQAQEANQSLKIAAARVVEARATAESYSFSLLPDLSIGGNAVRTQPASATLAAFGQPARQLHPYTLYNADGVLAYELDLFGQVRNNYKAFSLDADAESAAYRTALLALQADVAQAYFSLRALDSERQLVRDTVQIREKAQNMMQQRFDAGVVGQDDLSRTMSELAGTKADLLALDRQRDNNEHALAVLLGKIPSDFSFAQAPLAGHPPVIPAGLPSSLLERRPDIATAQASMAAANARIGVARAAFFPSITLTAGGGYESTQLSKLFQWTNRTWALGQATADAITMPVFDSGRNMARLDVAHASYDEAVASYRQQALVAFKDVEDNLASQRYLAEQSVQQDAAAAAAANTAQVVETRYNEGAADYFEFVSAQRDSLAASRAAIQIRGQRFMATTALIRALGGSWDDTTMVYGPPMPENSTPAGPAPQKTTPVS